jgi:hypothetical protein
MRECPHGWSVTLEYNQQFVVVVVTVVIVNVVAADYMFCLLLA